MSFHDPCGELRDRAAQALEELNRASNAMADFSISTPYSSEKSSRDLAGYLERMQHAFERERAAWETYYKVNLELLECIRNAYGEKPEGSDSDPG